MNLFSLLPMPYKIALVAGIIAAMGVVYGIWRHTIYKEGYQACVADQVKAVKEGEKRYEKTTVKVRRLSDDNLRNEFCKWVRDADHATCLKTLPAFR